MRKRLNRSRCRYVLDGVNIGRIHSHPRGVASRRCGILPDYFRH